MQIGGEFDWLIQKLDVKVTSDGEKYFFLGKLVFAIYERIPTSEPDGHVCCWFR